VLVNFLKFLIVFDWCFPIRKIKQKCIKKKELKKPEDSSKKTEQRPKRLGLPEIIQDDESDAPARPLQQILVVAERIDK
jgi:hypothetical protein